MFADLERKTDAEAAAAAGWTLLPITRSWRCGTCVRALTHAYWMTGREPTGEDGFDAIDPKSRGALPRATAESIAQPTVAP